MPNYNNSKIYKLVCNEPNLIYIGSTTQKLCQRLSKHKNHYKDNRCITSSKLFDKGDVKIILIEEFNCENKEQLLKRERHYIELLECVNKRLPGRTKEQWTNENKERVKENQKRYRIDNKEKLKEQFKNNYNNKKNTEKYKLQIKEYYEKNKSIKLSCRVCKMEMNKNSFSRHCKRKPHLENLN